MFLSCPPRVLIRTPGWHYNSWRGPFFPDGLPLKKHLQCYASQFRRTELNGVFYRTPSLDSVKSWQEQTGADFVFAWTASKSITQRSAAPADALKLQLLLSQSGKAGQRP
jgi:uncharacterized protein YecE (DUF72 family)